MISRTWTPLAAFINVIYLVFAAFFIGNFIHTHNATTRTVIHTVFIAIAVVGVLAMAIRLYVTYRQIKRRTTAIAKLGAQLSLSANDTKQPSLSPSFLVLEPRDPRIFNVLSGSDWRYSDFSQAIYRKTKNGEYKAATVYYSILELDLQRALPTMLFDSPKTHHKQFKKYFDMSQVQHLEGDFDQHFTTYFPKYYSIDALSIITPEVMQAMIAADEFDIEISGSKLYVYGPLIPVGQLSTLIAQGKEIRTKLMNNMVTYRDERLDYAAGRSGVSVYGAELRKNPFQGWSLILIGMVFIAAFVADPHHTAQLLIIGLLFALPGAWGMWHRWRINKRLDKSYAEHMDFLAQQNKDTRTLNSNDS